MPAAGTLCVVGVDGAAGDGGDRIFDKAGLVDSIRVDGHLHVVLVGDAQRAVDGRGRGAPVLVQLEADGAGLDLGGQAIGAGAIALAQEAEVDGVSVCGLQQAGQVPGPGRAGRGSGPRGRPGAAAEHGGDPGGERLVDQLRTDEMHVAIHAARCHFSVVPSPMLRDRQHECRQHVNQRAPRLSDSAPESGAETRNPTVSGSM